MKKNLALHEDLSRTPEVVGSSNRVFGLVFAAVFALIALWPLVRGREIRLWALAVAVGFVFFALVWPAALAPLNRIWTRFGLLLHAITSRLTLGLIFYGVITPMGWVRQLLGKNSLRLGFDRTATSYWIERRPPGPAPDSMPRQF